MGSHSGPRLVPHFLATMRTQTLRLSSSSGGVISFTVGMTSGAGKGQLKASKKVLVQGGFSKLSAVVQTKALEAVPVRVCVGDDGGWTHIPKVLAAAT